MQYGGVLNFGTTHTMLTLIYCHQSISCIEGYTNSPRSARYFQNRKLFIIFTNVIRESGIVAAVDPDSPTFELPVGLNKEVKAFFLLEVYQLFHSSFYISTMLA